MKVLELPDETKQRLEELRALSKKVEGGDKKARRELKLLLRESAPEVIARASDIGRKAQHLLTRAAAGGDPLVEYALSGRLDMMRREIAGESPTPLEVLLTERVVACWILVELFDALMAAQLSKDNPPENRLTPAALKYYLKWQESATRRYLSAIRELARVKKLESNTPVASLQFNQQINVATRQGQPPQS